jgi:protein SCO1/2
VLSGLVQSLRATSFEIGKEFDVLTVSFDPGDTWQTAATMKKAYLAEYRRPNAQQSWHFLTGDEESIRQLTESVGFHYKYDPESGEWAHATGIMVLTPGGRVAQYFYGLEYSARDLRLSIVESAASKIGSPVDKILLYCFHYNPANGKYGIVIMNVLALGAIATIAGLCTLIGVMLYRERKKA